VGWPDSGAAGFERFQSGFAQGREWCQGAGMKSVMMMGALVFWPAICGAAVRSGNAEVEWLAAGDGWRPGEEVRTAIRMKLDRGWHTYWTNPGDGGMKLSVTWRLPEGWVAGEVGHPVPMRFMTGDLPGFGYEGEVWFPVVLTPPGAGEGAADLEAEFSWLTCDDSACVPGDAVVSLTLAAGGPVAGEHAAAIDAALAKLPVPLAGAVLEVAEKADDLELQIEWPAGAPFDLAGAAVFPETPQVVDAGAEIRFVKSGAGWSAIVAKSEYAASPVRKLSLVLAGGDGKAVRLQWQIP
jgi:DsbC/DsbD-like thiol-disulfide interchange protein